MSILLTPEEIDGIWDDDRDARFNVLAERLAKALARKIHEWGEEICMNVDHENYRTFKHECRDCWQEFRAELEGK